MGRRQKKGRHAADRGADEAKARPNHRFAPDFGGFAVLAKPLELDLGQNLAKPVTNCALDFARVVGVHRSGEESRTKRNFDEEPRRVALVDRGFETRYP